MNDRVDPGAQRPFGSPYPSHPTPPKRGMPGWLIALLCTLGATVIGGPALLILGIHGVRRYIANAKHSEARVTVSELARRAAAQYDRVDAAGRHRMCPSASRPVPADIRMVRNRKYQSTPSEWRVDAAENAGFACLDAFWMDNPQYYSFNYEATARGFSATARGDLDGDGVTSSFVLSGAVDAAGTMHVAPSISEIQPEE